MGSNLGSGELALFEVPEPEVESSGGLGDQAFGAAVEAEVISRLLLLGHKVAVPVVDDDGVDLVVDYYWTVQVKSRRAVDRGAPTFTMVQNNARGGADPSRRRSAVRKHVDWFVFFVEGLGWWVVPRPELSMWSVVLGPRYDRYREAWHLFGSGGNG